MVSPYFPSHLPPTLYLYFYEPVITPFLNKHVPYHALQCCHIPKRYSDKKHQSFFHLHLFLEFLMLLIGLLGLLYNRLCNNEADQCCYMHLQWPIHLSVLVKSPDLNYDILKPEHNWIDLKNIANIIISLTFSFSVFCFFSQH